MVQETDEAVKASAQRRLERGSRPGYPILPGATPPAPRGKEVKNKEVSFAIAKRSGKRGTRRSRTGRRSSPRRGTPNGGPTESCPRNRRAEHASCSSRHSPMTNHQTAHRDSYCASSLLPIHASCLLCHATRSYLPHMIRQELFRYYYSPLRH